MPFIQIINTTTQEQIRLPTRQQRQ